MKRIGYLFDKIISIENLYLASKKAQRGKSNSHEVINWNKDLNSNIINLNKALAEMIKERSNDKSIASYNGWISHCNGKNLFKKYIGSKEIIV